MTRPPFYKPKESVIQFPTLWLPDQSLHHPWHVPSPWSRGLGRRCCCELCCTICTPTTEIICEDNAYPNTVEAIISDITNDDCSDCDDLNGTYILDFIGAQCGGVGTERCWYTYIFPSPVCDVERIDLRINPTSMQLFFSPETDLDCAHFTSFYFRKGGLGTRDCLGDQSYVLAPFVSKDNCDITGASATVTSSCPRIPQVGTPTCTPEP